MPAAAESKGAPQNLQKRELGSPWPPQRLHIWPANPGAGAGALGGGRAAGGAAAGTGSMARGTAATAASSDPHVRQNCRFLPFSAPHLAQRTVAGAAARGAPPGAPRGVPQAWQNALCGGLSLWHCRQSMQREWNRAAGLASRSWRRLRTGMRIGLHNADGEGRQRSWASR
jgi:hypothetical protein